MKTKTLMRSTKCAECGKTMAEGTLAAEIRANSFRHHPACVSAKKDALDDLLGDEMPAFAKRQADDEDDTPAVTTKGVADEVRYQFAQAKRELAALVNDRLEQSFDEALPAIVNDIQQGVKLTVGPLLDKSLADAKGEMKAEMSRQIARIMNEGVVRQEIVIRDNDGARELKGEVFHPRFAWIVKLAAAGKPIFIPGPTGSGKTHLAMQLARALNRPFGMISCSPGMTESKLTGRSIPNLTTGADVYRVSQFVQMYEEGGVFLFDEMDAADATVLLVINSALANGRMPVPDRADKPIAVKHKNFVCIAAANTFGTGADRQYVGRNRLDEATLDRFRMGTVPVDYSAAVERHLCPNVELYDLLTKWRGRIREHRLERVLSTRFMQDACDMSDAGATVKDIARAFFSGWRADEIKKVYGSELPDAE